LANGQIDQPNQPAELPQHLPANTDLLRMMAKRIWLEPGNLSEAFILRSDETGLSVCFDCTADHCATITALNRTYGAASLNVQVVTDLELTVEPDLANHAEIRGVPSKEVDRDRAEFLASQLARAATIVDQTRRPA